MIFFRRSCPNLGGPYYTVLSYCMIHIIEFVMVYVTVYIYCISLTVIDVTYPAGHIILSLLVLLAFNVTFGCVAGLLTMIEVK